MIQSYTANGLFIICCFHLIKLSIVTDFKSSTHLVDEEWPFEFGFIVGSCYVYVYTQAYSTCVHTLQFVLLFFSLKSFY